MEFNVEILTPSKEVVRTTASEVLIPSELGEVGILPGHQDLIGLLSTGALKIVTGGNDYWFMVSGGSFVVEEGDLTLLAEYGLDAESIETEGMDQKLTEVTEKLKQLSDTQTFEYQATSSEKARLEASQEAVRRHGMS